MKNLSLIILLAITISSCKSGYEVVTPFRNLGYSGNRLFPVKHNYSEFTFRFWINNSTSIDRVISISKDSADVIRGTLIEFGHLRNGKKYKEYFKETGNTPKDGFEIFIQKLDSLNVMDLKDKPLNEIVLHQPFSLYVVEFKKKTLFHSFSFESYYPNSYDQQDQYAALEKLLFEQFNLVDLFKLKTGTTKYK